MRTFRPNLRHFALFALLLAVPALAQSTETAPLIDVQMETNYILLLMALVQAVIIMTLGSVIKAMGGAGSLMNYLKGGRAAGVALVLFTVLSNDVQAATSYGGAEVSANTIFWFLAIANIVLFAMMAAQLLIVKGMISASTPEKAGVVAAVPEVSFADNLLKRMTRQVSLEEEKNIELDHEYDGIRELDNSLPPWWLWLFYGTIAWGVLYIVNVHVLDIWPQQIEEYDREMAQAKMDVEAYLALQASVVDENSVTTLLDETTLASGRSIYVANCKACHGDGGEGTVGPNLTDDHWKNGGGVKNIFKTIKYGVPERGMIAWKAQLKPTEIQAVSSYIVSLYGTNPPNAKDPEGELWVEEGTGPVDVEEPVKEEGKAVAVLN